MPEIRTLDDVRDDAIAEALAAMGGRFDVTARALGIDRKTLRRHLVRSQRLADVAWAARAARVTPPVTLESEAAE